MKVLYTTDLHGEIHLFEELKGHVKNSSIEIIVMGGDLLPSASIQTHGYENLILYQKFFIKQFLQSFLKDLLKVKYLKQVFLIPGNWDVAYPYIFDEHLDGIIDLSFKTYKLISGYEFIGFPFVPPTPFRPKDYERRDDKTSPIPPQKDPSYIKIRNNEEKLSPINPYEFLKTRETIEEELVRLPKPTNPKKAIYAMHSPPFGTQLDCIEGGEKCGSRSIRRFIENHQPLLTLHGHVHESPKLSSNYFDRIGETISINPGQFIFEGILHAVTFDLENVEQTLKHTCF